MRIAHVLKHCEAGNGHVHVAVDLACEQAAVGHEVHFASGGGAYEELLASRGVRLHRITERPASRAPITLRDLAGAIRSIRPDVVHAHMMSSAAFAAVICRPSRIPLVTTVHNSFDRHSVLMRVGDRIVAVSSAERELLLERGYPENRVRTVQNGSLGTARAALDGRDLGAVQQPTIATLSGLHRRKGVRFAIEAFARLATEFPEWHLTIIGEGPDRLELEALVGEHGLGGRVHLPGSTLTPLPWLRQAEIFVAPSLAEPFGLSVAEARSVGCAVIGSDVGGIPEVLDGGAAGMLVPPGDADALASALRLLLSDPAERGRWRRRAREGAERFSVSRMTADYDLVYGEVVAMRGSSRSR